MHRVHTGIPGRWRQRLRGGGLVLLSLLPSALWPQRAWAGGCGDLVPDIGACVDGAQYSVWETVAKAGWWLDRVLLQLAFALDRFRWWLVETAFRSAYQALTRVIDPWIVPFATVAVIIGCLAILLMPAFGRISVVNLRQALIWAVLAPLLLTISGSLIAQVEQVRSELGWAFFNSARAITPGAIFGPQGDDMAEPAALYPSSCGATTLERPGVPAPAPAVPGVPSPSPLRRMDDLAASVLWADARDIHCPQLASPDPDLPRRFYEAAPGGPGYAEGTPVADIPTREPRAYAIEQMQRGAIRTWMGLLPSGLAVLESLVHLLFALCLMVLWIGLPIGLPFVFFQQTAGPVVGLFRRGIGVIQISGVSSALLGIVVSALMAAAELRNAAAYIGFSLGASILALYLVSVALGTLKTCIGTLTETVFVATGLSVTQPFELAGAAARTALGVGAAVVTSGAAAGLAAAVAAKETSSGRYAAGAALGRIRPIARVGEVADAMGMGDAELVSGVVAGGRSARGGVRSLRALAATDAKEKNAEGRTFRDLADERRAERAYAQSQKPGLLQEANMLVAGGRAIVQGGRAAVEHGRSLAEDVEDGSLVYRLIDRGETAAVNLHHNAIQVVRERLTNSRRGAAISLNARRQIQMEERREGDDLPDGAITERRERVNLRRLLVQGYTVQENPNDTVTFWNGQQHRPAQRSPEGQPAARDVSAHAPRQNSVARIPSSIPPSEAPAPRPSQADTAAPDSGRQPRRPRGEES